MDDSVAMEGFFRRTYVTTTVVGALLGLWMWGTGHGGQALGLLVGVVIGLLTLGAVVFVVNAVVRPPEEQVGPRWPYVALHVSKFLLIAVAFYLMSRWAMDRLLFVAIGYGLPIAVAVLKVFGAALNRRLGVDGKQP